MDKTITEIAVDVDGNVIWEKPYWFNRLNGIGETIISDGITYEVISSNCDGCVVRTVLKENPIQHIAQSELSELRKKALAWDGCLAYAQKHGGVALDSESDIDSVLSSLDVLGTIKDGKIVE